MRTLPLVCLWASLTAVAAFCHLPDGVRPINGVNVARSALSLWSGTGPAFCERCGHTMIRRVPPGDEKERSCCTDDACGFVSYQNPKVIVGCICTWENKILLCQRAIAPCEGKWGFPQGFMELGETTREGAARETREEAGAAFDPADATLLAVYNLAGQQVQLVYTAPLRSGTLAAGIESQAVGLFEWAEIPWPELAFPTVGWALEYMRDEYLGGGVRPEEPRVASSLGVQQRTKRMDPDGNWRVEEG